MVQTPFTLRIANTDRFSLGLSTYTPAWVKQNPKRCPRAEIGTKDGKKKMGDVVSIFGAEAQRADGKAFSAFMRHIRAIDEEHATVIMVQVENEVSLLGDPRDRSPLAEACWNQPLPSKLLSKIHNEWNSHNEAFRRNFGELETTELSRIKTWDDMPGKRVFVEELFMAYHYSLYVEGIAAAGKESYPLPLYTNVWQNYAGDTHDENAPVAAGGDKPGDYPCGGGVTNVLDIWKTFAPSLDLIAPDIYLNDYAASCAAYRHRGQALLIPEQRRDEYGARRIWTAPGSYQCIGTAPFGIDTLSLPDNPFRRHYALLKSVKTYVLEAQARTDGCIGFFFDEIREDGSDPSLPVSARFGSWDLVIERSFVFGRPAAGSGIVIHKGKNEFLLIGWGFQVSFTSTDPQTCFNGLLRFEEKEVDVASGALRTLRLLNGDETRSGQFAIMPSEDPDYGGFPISITIPANTGIAVVEPYALTAE